MSINFYSTLNKHTLLTGLTLQSMTSYANQYGIELTITDNESTFKMTWKKFNDMIIAHLPDNKKYVNLNFIQLHDSPTNVVSLNIPIQEKPFLLTSSSGMNKISPEIAHIPDNAPVIIIFKKRPSNQLTSMTSQKMLENFGGLCNQMKSFDFILLFGILILVGYLIYNEFINKK